MKAYSAYLLFSCFIFVVFLVANTTAQDKDWRPVSQEELSSQKSSIEPDADAEAIFWEVRIDDSDSIDLSRKHYVRIKIYTERGREKYSKFDVSFVKGIKIKDLAARVIKKDGSIVDIKPGDVFEREIVKTNGAKLMAKSFAIPNIEPGVIIEYKYKEVFSYASARGITLEFQKDIPVQTLTYYYKPWKGDPAYQTYNFNDTKFVKDKGGYWIAKRTNIPAMIEEPQMPPENMVRSWMQLLMPDRDAIAASLDTVTYAVKDTSSPTKYWGGVGAQYKFLAQIMNKTNGELKKAASDITAGASSPEEKLKKLYEFCQTQIANTTFDPSITDEQREKLPQAKSVSDVLKRKSASSMFIDMLFGSLAKAAGFETRVVLSSDRSKMFFTPQMLDENLIHPAAVAVKVGSEWKYFNPGLKFAPYGMLVWYEEDTPAMLVGEDGLEWVKTPYAKHESSVTKRTGKFSLLEDGTIEGSVQIEMYGQPALLYRLDNYEDAPAKIEEGLKEDLKLRMSLIEVSNVSIENLMDSSKPLVQKYTIRVPNYAQKTGKRLFLQPGFFEYGSNPVFSSSSRKYDLFFRFPWSEDDKIEFTYPQNFDLDNADTPGIVSDPAKIAMLDIKISRSNSAASLSYSRHFHFGGNGYVLFDASNYKPIKGLFDAFHTADSHTITLKQR
ncbi:MAG: DUF3857 and transglutaminase domain-containing protein [Chloracidobacterium sp.]|nr:DUF3857 and transglutaminase domain-containing protein [Chloracidobacterium sp.]